MTVNYLRPKFCVLKFVSRRRNYEILTLKFAISDWQFRKINQLKKNGTSYLTLKVKKI